MTDQSNEQKNRVFVSYSHDDRELVEPLVNVLEGVADVLWDKTFRFGEGFHRQIQLHIAHAHAFVPVITARSASRGWVHQEIGFAMAHNIPVLPIAIGSDALPGEMIQSIHALRVPKATCDDCARTMAEQFTSTMLENLVADYEDPERALYQCARETEDRARMMVDYCRDVHRLERFGMVRQAGALSSFHIPKEPLLHPVWNQRYGKVHERSRHHCTWQRKERMAFDEHARVAGFKIIINPTLTFANYGPEARRIRIEWLLRFLKATSEFPNGCVALDSAQHVEKSTTIIGDWFSAEAVSAAIGKGYRHTIFTRHAPSVRAAMEEFDSEFDALLPHGWTLENSREKSIDALEQLLAELGGPVKS